jgi:hypothetical protein
VTLETDVQTIGGDIAEIIYSIPAINTTPHNIAVPSLNCQTGYRFVRNSPQMEKEMASSSEANHASLGTIGCRRQKVRG